MFYKRSLQFGSELSAFNQVINVRHACIVIKPRFGAVFTENSKLVWFITSLPFSGLSVIFNIALTLSFNGLYSAK